MGERSWRQASWFCVALGPVSFATLTPAAEGECGPCRCWGSDPWPCLCWRHEPPEPSCTAGPRRYLLRSHAGAFPIVKVILQVAVPYAELELLQEGFVLHKIQCIEHVEPFLRGSRKKQERVKRERSCLAFLSVSTTYIPAVRRGARENHLPSEAPAASVLEPNSASACSPGWFSGLSEQHTTGPRVATKCILVSSAPQSLLLWFRVRPPQNTGHRHSLLWRPSPKARPLRSWLLSAAQHLCCPLTP